MITNPLGLVQAAGTELRAAGANGPQQKGKKSDFDMFLKLLLAEMKNQDPSNATDPTKYVSQIASFSALKENTITNTKLDALIDQMRNAQGASYVGKYLDVKLVDGTELKGRIKSVTISEEGLVANLDSGKSVLIGPGVNISDGPEKRKEV